MVLIGLAAALAFAVPALVLVARLPGSVVWRSPARALGACLTLLALINGATVAGGSGWDSTGWFLADNAAFAAMTGAAAAGWAWARRWAGRPGGSRWAWVLGTTAAAAWLAGLWAALVAPGGTPWAVFAAGTLWAAGAAGAAVGTLVPVVRLQRGRRRAGALAALAAVVLLLALSVADEWGGPHFPLSGLWLAGFAAAVYSLTFRWLRPPEALSPAEAWARRLGLSAREREVLRALLGNPDRTAAAEALFISPVTVKNHLASLYRRTGVSDLTSLLDLARSQGWGGPDHRP